MLNKINLIKYKTVLIVLFLLALVSLTFAVFDYRDKVFAANAEPGCYKVENGQLVKVTCPTSNVIYDDGNGANTFSPAADKCYIYSQNLYDGQQGYGDPYVMLNCANLIACPVGQELRYNTDAIKAPVCVSVDAPFENTFETPTPSQRTTSNVIGGDITDADGQNLIDWVNNAIGLLSGIVILAIAGSIIYAGIQYSTAGGNPQAASSAKKRIIDAVYALVAFLFMAGFLQWIIPGGILFK